MSSINNHNLIDVLKSGISSKLKDSVIAELKAEVMSEFEGELDNLLKERVKGLVLDDINMFREWADLTDKYLVRISLNGEDINE